MRMILNLRTRMMILTVSSWSKQTTNVYLSGRLAAPRAACGRRAFWAQMRCRGGAAGARSVGGHRATATRRQIRQDFLVSLATSFRLRFETVYHQRRDALDTGTSLNIEIAEPRTPSHVFIEHHQDYLSVVLAQGVIRINITLYEWPIHALWIVSNLLCKQSTEQT